MIFCLAVAPVCRRLNQYGHVESFNGRMRDELNESLFFGLGTLRDLPDREALEDAGLLSKEKLLAGIPQAGGRMSRL